MIGQVKIKCKFCKKEIPEDQRELFYMGYDEPNKEDFVHICYDCADELRDAIEDIAEESR